MKRRLLIGGAAAILVAAALIGVGEAGTYNCDPPPGTVGGVRVWCSHYISIEGQNREYFRSAVYSNAATAIDRLGGWTWASREYCGDSIRASTNHGGWVQHNSRNATAIGGLQFGERCSGQAAGTAADHDWAHRGQTRRYTYISPKELR